MKIKNTILQKNESMLLVMLLKILNYLKMKTMADNGRFWILCLCFLAHSWLFAQCYEPIRNDGIDFYNKAQYTKALSCFMAAQRCQDKPDNHDLSKWINNCNTKINSAQGKPKPPSKETDTKKNTQTEQPNETNNGYAKQERTICYLPVIKAAQVSLSCDNYIGAKELFMEAQKCPDLPADNELALWIKICDDEIMFAEGVKEFYTPYYINGNEFFKRKNFEKAKENFVLASKSEYIPVNSDVTARILQCEQKIYEKRYNTLREDTVNTTLWGKEGVFMGSVQYNKPNGKGVFLFNRDQLLNRIEADFDNGDPVGIVLCVFNNLDEFLGTVKDNDFETGTYKYANGDVYTGAFMQRMPNGNGEITYFNGGIYKGIVVNGKKEGFGKYFDEKGELIHEGIFTNDFPEKDYPNRVMYVSFNWITIPEGTFLMGCSAVRDCINDDRPAHSVSLSEFEISDREVTVSQYRTFCEATGRSMPSKPFWGWDEEHPIVNVTWNDAVAFCQWTNCRLPTEAEWEYAAQDAKEQQQYLYSGSNDLREIAYFINNTTSVKTVGKKKPNELLIFDMSGNVSEWVQDWFGAYTQSAQENPKGPTYGTHKIVRGGSWNDSELECRITYRGKSEPNSSTNFIGFRVVRKR